jgi:hypothetical protein
MSGFLSIFIVVFILVLAAVCALVVLRMLGSARQLDAPRFPRHRTRHHYAPSHPASGTGAHPGRGEYHP